LKVPILSKLIEKRALTYANEFLKGNEIYYPAISGINITEKRALQISAFFACIKIISEDVATLPLKLYEITKNPMLAYEDNRILFL
jgi:phage portal protein BeeE